MLKEVSLSLREAEIGVKIPNQDTVRRSERACEYVPHTLRQAQGERGFPFVVSLSNHTSTYFSQTL